jgi:hypothetical protein
MSQGEIYEMIQEVSKLMRRKDHCQQCINELEEKILHPQHILSENELLILKMELWFVSLFSSYDQDRIAEMIQRLDRV